MDTRKLLLSLIRSEVEDRLTRLFLGGPFRFTWTESGYGEFPITTRVRTHPQFMVWEKQPENAKEPTLCVLKLPFGQTVHGYSWADREPRHTYHPDVNWHGWSQLAVTTRCTFKVDEYTLCRMVDFIGSRSGREVGYERLVDRQQMVRDLTSRGYEFQVDVPKSRYERSVERKNVEGFISAVTLPDGRLIDGWSLAQWDQWYESVEAVDRNMTRGAAGSPVGEDLIGMFRKFNSELRKLDKESGDRGFQLLNRWRAEGRVS